MFPWLTPSGRSSISFTITRSFDKKGTGFVPGNGCGAVVLKRLGDALRDKDRIYAVIRETSINNDGNEKAGYTAPGLGGITSAVRDAYSISGIDPALTGYVECHLKVQFSYLK